MISSTKHHVNMQKDFEKSVCDRSNLKRNGVHLTTSSSNVYPTKTVEILLNLNSHHHICLLFMP